MRWIWLLPLLLTTTMAVVLYPFFSRQGNSPLPQGLEDDPWMALTQQRDRLLRQLKEWQLEYREDVEGNSVQAELEHELMGVLTQLDQLEPQPEQTGKGGSYRNPMDKVFGATAFVLLAVLSGGLYWSLGTPIPPPTPRHPLLHRKKHSSRWLSSWHNA